MFPSFAPMIVRYGITRAYPWRWFPATALIAILILYVFLIPLNCEFTMLVVFDPRSDASVGNRCSGRVRDEVELPAGLQHDHQLLVEELHAI